MKNIEMKMEAKEIWAGCNECYNAAVNLAECVAEGRCTEALRRALLTQIHQAHTDEETGEGGPERGSQ